MVSICAIDSQYLINRWSVFDKYLVSICSIDGEYLCNRWSVFDQYLVSIWSRWCDGVWLVFRTAPFSPPASPSIPNETTSFYFTSAPKKYMDLRYKQRETRSHLLNKTHFHRQRFNGNDPPFWISIIVFHLSRKCQFAIPAKFTF